MSVLSTLIIFVTLAGPPAAPPPPPLPDPDGKIPQVSSPAADQPNQVDDFVNKQISDVLKKKLVKKLPKQIDAQFPFRLQKRTDLSPEEERAWVDESPNRVTFAGRMPIDLEKEFDIQVLERRPVGKQRYEIDIFVKFPLRDIYIRLDIPPSGVILEGIHNDFHLFLTVDFEWDYIGQEDPRTNLFGFLNARDIGIFPGGTKEYVASPEGKLQPWLLRGLHVQSKLGMRDLAITGVRGKPMYRDGRFVGNQGLFKLLAGVANIGFDIAKVATQEDDLIERIVENAMNDALYDAQPKMIELANGELFVEEVGPDGTKVKPVDILKEQLAKQALPTLLPGKTE